MVAHGGFDVRAPIWVFTIVGTRDKCSEKEESQKPEENRGRLHKCGGEECRPHKHEKHLEERLHDMR
jgi:hypothetical protein